MAAIIVTLNRIQNVPFYVNRIDSSAAQKYNEEFQREACASTMCITTTQIRAN